MSLHQFLLEPITCHAWNRDRTRKCALNLMLLLQGGGGMWRPEVVHLTTLFLRQSLSMNLEHFSLPRLACQWPLSSRCPISAPPPCGTEVIDIRCYTQLLQAFGGLNSGPPAYMASTYHLSYLQPLILLLCVSV